jgi:hypothetical protein
MMKPKRARSTKGGINWRQQIEKDMEYCEERLLTDGGLDPLFLIHTKARLLLFPAPWRDESEKDRHYQMVALLCIAESAIGLTSMAEGWFVEAPVRRVGESEAEFDERLRSMDPDTSELRREVVTCQSSYYDRTGRKVGLMKTREIVRGADGKPTGLATLPGLGDAVAQHNGRVHRLLPDAPPSHEDRAAAQAFLRQLNTRTVRMGRDA